MQVPERLALIGGSILLSSTLVFTLKSQASSILPKIEHPISSIYGHIGDTQRSVDFDGNFKDAQKNGETTGTWGTSKYYIDKDMNMHVGKGQLVDTVFNTIGQDKSDSLNSITFDQPAQAPENSSGLLAQMAKVTDINNLDNLDVSKATDMGWMFNADAKLGNVDVSNWNTERANNISYMFNGTYVQKLDLSSWDTSHANTDNLLANDYSLNEIKLGNNDRFSTSSISGNWNNGSQSVDPNTMGNGDSHSGTWTRQYEQVTNMSPYKTYDYWGWNGQVFTIPIQKGKTYWISYYNSRGTSGGKVTLEEADNGGIYNLGYKQSNAENIIPFVANASGTGHIHFWSQHDGNGLKAENLNITQSDSYVPYNKTTQNHNNQ